jgi:peptide/nickel transport system ATP-binding protein
MTTPVREASSPVEETVVSVRDLRIEVAGSGEDVVDGVSFTVRRGEVLGLVGESGCGKTTLALALLGYRRRGLRFARGDVVVDGRNLLEMRESDLRKVRGNLVSYVPQDPATALNPALRVQTQVMESLTAHDFEGSQAKREARLAETLADVKLPATKAFLRSYPHQLSGGQQQRVAIAMAFVNQPGLIVMDEPTTGLDVTTQAHVLTTIREMCRSRGVAALYVTHDLAVVATLAHRVALMYAGKLAEVGSTDEILSVPRHPYVQGLIRAVPDVGGRRVLRGIPGQAPEPGQRGSGCFFAPRCPVALPVCQEEFPDRVQVAPGHEVWCVRATEQPAAEAASPDEPSGEEREPSGRPLLEAHDLVAWYGSRKVLHGVGLAVSEQTCVALVGESGSGKTTLARCVAGLHTGLDGDMRLRGDPLVPGARTRPAEVRQAIQYIFQNPYASLNPRRTVGESVGQALRQFSRLSRREVDDRVAEALESVALSPSLADRYPHQLSGGQRQRVAIARALAVQPDLLVCDEVTSSLDVSVQAVIIELLAKLQRERGLAMLFVTHNLALIRSIAQQVAVMSDGRIVEWGDVEEVLDHPKAGQTRLLLRDIPRFGTASKHAASAG